MNDDEVHMITSLAADVSKGLVSMPRAKRQLAEWARAGKTIDVGECTDWLDRNVHKAGHEEMKLADGTIVDVATDHRSYYDEHKVAAAKDIADAAEEGHRILGTDITTQQLAQANAKAIDVSRRVNELTARADDEMGVVDVEPVESRIIIEGES